MAALEPAAEVWIHGLLPGTRVSEESLLKLLEKKPASIVATPDHMLSLDVWTSFAGEGLGLSAPQAAAVMRLTFVLTTPLPMPPDHALRVPLGSLLLLLWVQWAHHELGDTSATNVQRAQATTGEVWPSLLRPPAAAAKAVLTDKTQQPSARSIAVQSRLISSQLVRRRRKLVQNSLHTLLQLAGAGAERLYAEELDRLRLLMRPDQPGADRLISRNLPSDSLSAALGLWKSQPKASLPIASLVPTLRSALIEVVPGGTPAQSSLALAPAPSPRSPLTAAPTADAMPLEAAGGGTPGTLGSPPPLTPIKTVPPPLRPTVSTSDIEEIQREPSVGTLAPSPESLLAPGYEVLRLHGAKRRTIVLRDAEVRSGTLQLIDCHGCYIYVLAPIRAAEILGCTGCTIVAGAVSHVLSASHCEGLKLIATARALRVANCHESTLYLCVNSPPLLWGENHRLNFAPHGTIYEGLAEHMTRAHVSAALRANFWRAPVNLAAAAVKEASPSKGDRAHGKDGGAAAGEHKWAVLPPSRFLPFHVPIDVPAAARNGEGVPPQCELPGEYAAALFGHVQRLALFGDEISNLRCPDATRRDVQAAVHAGFKNWLVRTGNIRQVADLMDQQSL